ncbi:hypothetical protein QV65_23785 [Rhodococcus erythropolis]|nr:hypothetical protein QV65_23785 [Rhodococcus erythropolis]
MPQRQRCEIGDAVRPFLSVVEGSELVGETARESFLGADLFDAEQNGTRRTAADQRREPTHGPLVHRDSEGGRGDSEASGRCHDAQIRRDGQLGTGADGRTVDSGNDGDGRRVDRPEHFEQAVGEALHVDVAGQVRACTERRSLTGDDDNVRMLGDCRVHRVPYCDAEFGAERITTLVTLQLDGHDVAVTGEPDHVRSLSFLEGSTHGSSEAPLPSAYFSAAKFCTSGG